MKTSQEYLQLKEELKNRIEGFIQENELEIAEKVITQFESMVPLDADIFCYKGIISYMRNDLMRAEIYFKQGNMLDPNHVDILYNLGLVNYEMHNLSASFRAFKKISEKSSDFEMVNKTNKFLEQIKSQIQSKNRSKVSLITNTSSGCNAKALFNKMPDWLANKYEIRLFKEQQYEHYDSFVKESDLVITTHGNYPSRYGQLNLELWHGFPLKGMANMDYGDSRNSENVRGYWDGVDYISSYSGLFNTLFNSCVGTRVDKYVVTGSPRNDYLNKKVSDELLRKVLNISNIDNQKLIMYSPTFRSAYFNPNKKEGNRHWANLFGFERYNESEFDRFLEENNLYLIVKLHPVEERIHREAIELLHNPRIILLLDEILEENSIDLYEILAHVDLLITDYSSIYFDFLLTGKPIVFAPIDIETYRATRGFLLEPYEYWTPGPKVINQEQLQKEIIKCMNDIHYYDFERNQIKKLVHQFDDFQATDRVWGVIDGLLNDKSILEELDIKENMLNINDINDYKEKLLLCIEEGDLVKASALMEYYKEIFNEDSDIKYLYGTVCYLKNDFQSALSYLHHSYFMNREHFNTLYKLGLIYEEMERLEEARFFYHKVSSIKLESDMINELKGKIVSLETSYKCEKKRILIGSPIHQQPEILTEFLLSLKELETDSFEIQHFFIDDNIDENSSEILNEFQKNQDNVFVMNSNDNSYYNTSGQTHEWKEHLIWKVANFKEDMIHYAKINHYDYIFLIDSDIVLNPKTLVQLFKQQVDIISNIFWTKWTLEGPELPQVWLRDQYILFESYRNENLSQEDISIRMNEFIQKLRVPGVYQVGGLGACTLISRKAIEKGVSFREIPNLTFWGEDRHFCIRAAALGLDMYVDTHLPAFHIYRKEDVLKVPKYKTLHNNQ